MKDDHHPVPIATNESQPLPFVNEECGDTMWDNVLKEAEEKLINAIQKTGGHSSETVSNKEERYRPGQLLRRK